MKRVYLAQLKCPNNHCIMAAADVFDSKVLALDLARQLGVRFGDLIKAGMKPGCAICDSTDMKVDIRATPFLTMEEAMPTLKALEARQIETARFLRESKN